MNLAFAAVLAFVAGVPFGIFGAGGSILLVPVLVYILGIPVKMALGMALLILTATGAVTALSHARAGDINAAIGAQWAALSMIGSYLGGRLAGWIPAQVLIGVFAGVVVLASLRMLRPEIKRVVDGAGARASWVRIAVVGFSLGVFTGTLGVGGGFLLVPALVLVGRVGVKPAIGTSAMVVSINSFGGFLGFASHTHFPFVLTATIALCNVLGGLVGSHVGEGLSSRRLRPAFAIFLLCIGSVMVTRSVVELISH